MRNNVRMIFLSYFERYKYRTYVHLIEKNKNMGTEKDLYEGETFKRHYINEDFVFVGFPTFFFLISITLLVVTLLNNITNGGFLLNGAIVSLLLSLFLTILLFFIGKKNHKITVFVDTLTAIGLVEIVLLIIVCIPFFIISLFA